MMYHYKGIIEWLVHFIASINSFAFIGYPNTNWKSSYKAVTQLQAITTRQRSTHHDSNLLILTYQANMSTTAPARLIWHCFCYSTCWTLFGGRNECYSVYYVVKVPLSDGTYFSDYWVSARDQKTLLIGSWSLWGEISCSPLETCARGHSPSSFLLFSIPYLNILCLCVCVRERERARCIWAPS